MKMEKEKLSFDTMEIMKLLPHRYPFLLVDRIVECVPGEYSLGYKNLSMNESFFQGHFPDNPIFPGVLQLEALAQNAAPIVLTLPQFAGKLALFAGLDGVRFKNIVRPGDRFDMECRITRHKGPVCKCSAKGTVDGKLCVEAEITVALK
ncbi:3-hydroxyacyl-[acyl-carrier-protein] dehydratase [Candidatus Gastranaerophilus sp. (ex Termes propinquus)]|nr:3-hydroxyacyl-[acyl-carrier-protein] dehydratase [Candidatus Gastranaerophilus sp. (ex Termes propinquus)]